MNRHGSDERKQNYWVLLAIGPRNKETLLYCNEHRRITLTWEGEPFCCLKAKLESVIESATSVCGNSFEMGDDADHYRIPKKYVNDLYGKLSALEPDEDEQAK
jgi:hypothetical protein